MRSNLADDTFRAEVAAADLNGANIFVGEAVGLIDEVLPAATILRRMVLDATDTLRDLANDTTGLLIPGGGDVREGLRESQTPTQRAEFMFRLSPTAETTDGDARGAPRTDWGPTGPHVSLQCRA